MVLLAELLNSIAGELAASYQQGKELVQNQLKQIEKTIEKSAIMNSYLLFGILKQTSECSQKEAQ